MNKYDQIMERIVLSDEARERILKKAVSKGGKSRGKSFRTRQVQKWMAMAACFALLMAGFGTVLLNSQRGAGPDRPAGLVSAGQDQADSQNENSADSQNGNTAGSQNENSAGSQNENSADNQKGNTVDSQKGDSADSQSGNTAVQKIEEEMAAAKEAAPAESVAREDQDAFETAEEADAEETPAVKSPKEAGSGKSGWVGLLLVFAVAIVISAIGFIKYVYYFSVGYGFSIAGIGVALAIFYRDRLTAAPLIMCLLLFLYGIRLGAYLLIREYRSSSYNRLLKNEIKSRVSLFASCAIWISCALLYTCECVPLLFRLENGVEDDVFAVCGIVLMAAGIACEIVADFQKSRAKKQAPGRFVSSGLYRIVRCPNYFGEVLLWTGMAVTGLSACHGWLQWTLLLAGYAGIIYVMFSGARRLEIRQDKNYGEDPEYQEYIRKTPILLPLLPLYSVKKYKWLVA